MGNQFLPLSFSLRFLSASASCFFCFLFSLLLFPSFTISTLPQILTSCCSPLCLSHLLFCGLQLCIGWCYILIFNFECVSSSYQFSIHVVPSTCLPFVVLGRYPFRVGCLWRRCPNKSRRHNQTQQICKSQHRTTHAHAAPWKRQTWCFWEIMTFPSMSPVTLSWLKSWEKNSNGSF